MKQHPMASVVDMIVSSVVGVGMVAACFLVGWLIFHLPRAHPPAEKQDAAWDLGDSSQLQVKLTDGKDFLQPGEDHRVGDHLTPDQLTGTLALGTDDTDYTRVLRVDRDGYVKLSPEDETRLVTRIGKELQRILDRNEQIAQPQFSHGVSASGTQRVFLTPTDADTVVFDGAGNCLLNCEKVFLK